MTILVTWQLASPEWKIQEREKARRKPAVFSVLILDITHNDFGHFLFKRSKSLSTACTYEDFTFNERRSVKEFVNPYKTSTGPTWEVVHIPLLLTPH